MPAELCTRGSAADGSGEAHGEGKRCDPELLLQLPLDMGNIEVPHKQNALGILRPSPSSELWASFCACVAASPCHQRPAKRCKVSWCFLQDGPCCFWLSGRILTSVVIFCLLFFSDYFHCKWLCGTLLRRSQGTSPQKRLHKAGCGLLFLRKWLDSPTRPVLALFC